MSHLFSEAKQEYDDDHKIAETEPAKITFGALEKWLKDAGAKYDKLKIRYYTPIYRGVHAA